MRRRLVGVLSVFLVTQGAMLAGNVPAYAFTPPPPNNAAQVTAAVDAGQKYLLSQQDAQGCWTSSGVTAGVTALAMLAIIHSVPGAYPALPAVQKGAVDKGTGCLLSLARPDGTVRDTAGGNLANYNTSVSVWALSAGLTSAAVTAAVTGARTWLVANQRNAADPAGRADAGGNVNNGGWYYEGGTTAAFVEHSNSSLALQGLAASGGIPAATANLAQGYFTCLQRRLPACGTTIGPFDDGFIYSQQLSKGGTQTSATGSGSFALSLTGVPAGDPRILDAIAYLDASLGVNACDNLTHSAVSLASGWSPTGTLVHYAQWAVLKAHELAGIADDVNNPANWYFKLASCLTTEQRPDGGFTGSLREDDILATSFALLTLEKVSPTLTATTLTETATPSSGNAPLAVTFTYKETNIGINAISLVSVTGSICGAATYASGDGNSNGMLDPGETWVFTCTHTFNAPGSFTDNATATGIFTATKEPAPKEIASATVGVKPERGTLKICKVAGPGVPVNTLFTFNAGGTSVSIPAGPAPGGYCKVVANYVVGSNVGVMETVPSGVHVAQIAVGPPDRIVGAPNLGAGTVLVAIGKGVTEVTFTNARTGFIEICKQARGPGVTGSSQFSFAGHTLTVPVGSCGPATEVPVGTLTITETFQAGTALVACATLPAADLVSCDLPSQSAKVKVKPGDVSTQTVVTFINRHTG